MSDVCQFGHNYLLVVSLGSNICWLSVWDSNICWLSVWAGISAGCQFGQ